MAKKRGDEKHSSEKHGEKNGRSRSKRRGYHSKEDSNSDTDSVLNDTASVSSGPGAGYAGSCGQPDQQFSGENGGESGHKNGHNQNEHEDDGAFVEVDDFESKLDQVLDYLQGSVKAAKSRLGHYESLAKALTTRFCLDYLDDRKITVQDILEHGLRRADDEAGAAAVILSLVLISLGSTAYCDELYREMFPTLDRLFMDTKAKPHVRAKCATALSLGCFITDSGLEKSRQVLGQLLAVGFTTVKGHPEPTQLAALNHLRATCLDNFSFLVTIEADDYLVDALEENIDQLAGCLDSPYLGLRVAAGECIALLVERARAVDADDDSSFYLAHFEEICAKLQALATDSQKSKSKKELREQRLNFRQILRTVVGEHYGEETVKVGHQERVVIGCWQSRRYYDTFCSVLGSGMSLHLTQNILLRDIFDMGAVALDLNGTGSGSAHNRRVSKMEKNFINNYNRKTREINRGKQRGKRADFDV